MTPAEINAELLRLSRRLDAAHVELEARTRAYSEAEHVCSQAWSNAYLASSGTVDERKAYCMKAVGKEKYAAHLAEGLKVSALEAVRSIRAQLSAVQTAATLLKSEMSMAGRYE